MRPHLHRPSPAHRGAGATSRAASERSSAEDLLGASHPLVTVLGRCETAFEQVVAVTAVQASATVFLLGNHEFGLSLVLGAVVVQLALGCRLAALRLSRRELCVELVVEGRQELPLACLRRECRRLREPRMAPQLARSIDEVVQAATRAIPRAAASRTLFDVRAIRPVTPELRQIVSLLRVDHPPLQGVAAVERLLSSAATPLYGSEVEPLRQELCRARYLLSLNR
jgi:hypothetical protein